jgi:hypothetical protein
MMDRQNKIVTTSLTMIDVHDIARSSRTYGVKKTFIAHPAPTIRKLSRTLKNFWEEGFGAEYNPNRKDALEIIDIVSDLDDAIHKIDLETGKLPKLIATSAKPGGNRITFAGLKELLTSSDQPYLLMFGTGHGMSDELLNRANLFLEPINGPTEYNHLSVRSACAIMLDRLFGL